MLSIRWALQRDIPAVLAIDAASYERPWSEPDLLRCLRQRNCISMVVEHNAPGSRCDTVVAFVVYEISARHLAVLRFAVAPEFRRRGVGTCLLDKIKYKVISHRRLGFTALVPDSDLSAHLFARANDVRAVAAVREPVPVIRFGWAPSADDWAAHGEVSLFRVVDESGA